MVQAQSKRQKNIKSKLMAAICMLLVSSIMMVSSTYAWFTLSTAPEVTGIQTAVGANGNLEIALVPKDGNLESITSGVNSTAAWTTKNTTWGNLVDLSSEDYGLQSIMLYPSALNAATVDANGNPLTLAAALLQTPSYGTDGRVSELAANTVTSSYAVADKTFPQNDEMGVRAVGVASGMTDRQLAYRNYRSAASTSMSQAKTLASQSLSANGDTLANIALTHATNSASTHTQADVTALLAIVNDLLGYESGDKHVTGVLEYIEDAYIQYIIAYGASQLSLNAGMDDTEFKAFQSTVETATSLEAAITALKDAGVTLPDALVIDDADTVTTPVEELIATKAKVVSAQTDLGTLKTGGSDAIPWASDTANNIMGISTPLYKLADVDAMEINGVPASEVKARMSEIINSVAGGGLTVTIATGGGVYADVADHCGDYNASITIEKVEYNGLVLNNMNARMTTDSSKDPNFYLVVMGTAVETAQAPASASGVKMPITDMYGYIIDLAFRTNAAESNLLLQVEGTDRIYGDEGNNADTMGSGSTMTFKATTTDFSNEQVMKLMDAVRIVFFSGTDVLATAKLDTTKGNWTTEGYEAPMSLYTVSGTSISYDEATYAANSGETYYKLERTVTYYELASSALVSGATVYLKNGDTYTETTYTAPADGATDTNIYYGQNVTEKYTPLSDADAADYGEQLYVQVSSTTGTATEQLTTDTVITPLTQNQKTAVSVLVYLDGTKIENSDVAATSTSSVTGTMNLQFASSANLVPMEYAALSGKSAGSGTPTATTYDVTIDGTAADAATANTAYTFTVDSGKTVSGITIGGTAYTIPAANADGSYTIPADAVTGAIVITTGT